MVTSNTIIKLSDIKDRSIESENTVLCYGHFNIIHPGHIRFLEFSKRQGKSLFIALLPDSQLPQELYFRETERAQALLATGLVNKIIILDSGDLVGCVALIMPNILAFGKELEKKPPPVIAKAKKFIEDNGGKVIFHAGDIRYANANLLDQETKSIDHENEKQFEKICTAHNFGNKDLIDLIEKYSNQKILVIGDSIIDQYVACDALGMSAEAPVLVVKELEGKEYVGGAAVVALHTDALGGDCHFISIVGNDQHGKFLEETIKEKGLTTDITKDETRPTTYKIRYMVDKQKLFRVSRLSDQFINKKIETTIIDLIKKMAPKVNAIVVSDFVYGLITPAILKVIQDVSKKYSLIVIGDVQCSSQVGSVTKFKNFTLISATEREARIALSNNESSLEDLALRLIKETNCKILLLKLGSEGFICYDNSASSEEEIKRQHFPALVSNPIDLTGAGDSLLASIALSLASNATGMEASAIGACIAALSVKKMGNTPILKSEILDYLNSERI